MSAEDTPGLFTKGMPHIVITKTVQWARGGANNPNRVVRYDVLDMEGHVIHDDMTVSEIALETGFAQNSVYAAARKGLILGRSWRLRTSKKGEPIER